MRNSTFTKTRTAVLGIAAGFILGASGVATAATVQHHASDQTATCVAHVHYRTVFGTTSGGVQYVDRQERTTTVCNQGALVFRSGWRPIVGSEWIR